MIKQNVNVNADTPSIWFIFSAEKLLVPHEAQGPLIESWNNLGFAHAYKEQIVQVGEHNEQMCYLIDMGNEVIEHSGAQLA
ncbi:MAG: NAD(+) diphosphatase, partial [Paraglaciecola chathamensis]